MNDLADTIVIPIGDLQLGMYIHLDLNWMEHPFAKSHFLIQTEQQLETLKTLGLSTVRVKKSTIRTEDTKPIISEVSDSVAEKQTLRDTKVGEQRDSRKDCERRFNETLRNFRQAMSTMKAQPTQSIELIYAVTDSLINMVYEPGEMYLRILNDVSGDRASLHGLNTAILGILLGKAYGLTESSVRSIGVGALIHDIGKMQLPERVRYVGPHFTMAERNYYQEHVQLGVTFLKRMDIPELIIKIVQEHHEFLDGSGFPGKLTGTSIAVESKIVAIADRYDNLCNPAYLSLAMTPHEALRMMFAQEKHKFDPRLMELFVKLLGIYPPGSLVQLTDERYALVMSVNSNAILKPNVVVYDSKVPVQEALIVSLGSLTDIGIRRSLRPQQLPEAVLNYFSSRTRLCYFFERPMYVSVSEGSV